MNKKISPAAVAVLVLLAFFGCSTLKVTLETPNNVDLSGVKKVAFVKITFSERTLPFLPLIDAGMYNAQVSSVKPDLSAMEDKVAADATQLYAQRILDTLKKDVLLVKNPFTVVEFDAYESPKVASASDIIEKIAKENQAQIVVATVIRVQTLGVGAFGVVGSSLLQSRTYIFDEQANVKGKAYFASEAYRASPTDTSAYGAVLDTYKVLGPQVIDLLFKN